MFSNLILIAAVAVALLAVWLALEPLASRVKRHPRVFSFRRRMALRPWMPRIAAIRLIPSISGADGSTDVLDAEAELTEGEKKELKDVGDKVAGLRESLVKRIGEMKGREGEDKAEVERREKELAGQVDTLIGLAKKRESSELSDFKADLDERLHAFEEQMKKFGQLPANAPHGASKGHPSVDDRYDGDNLFLDMKAGLRDHEKADRIRAYEEKFRNEGRQKSWAIGDLEDADLVLPDIQQALPFLRAQTKIVQLFRELRTSSPAVEFPVFKSGLAVGHVEPGEPKPESTPTFDLEVARVFTIAGITDVPNQTLEDFPAARGWIATELGAATGVQEENDVLNGDGTGEPLGLFSNTDIPHRKVDTVAEASTGRNIISSIFRAAQQVRVKGFTEPTDVGLNPAVWTDVVLSFENNIGFLYGPPQMGSGSGPVLEQPPARILGLPVTWSSYVPTNYGKENKRSPIVVGNFQDGIVLRRAPFRIDIDTSVGFKKNLTSFRGEERMGFIVVRPKSFVIIDEVIPSAVE